MAAPIIPLYTGIVPQRTQTQTDFSNNADSWLLYQSPLAANYNSLASYIDAVAATVDSNATIASADAISASSSKVSAQAAANFKGEWSTLTGAITVPSSVLHNNIYWLLLNDLADVTTSEPAITNDWAKINSVNIDNVRMSLLDNPLTHILKKNKIVETLSGALTWSRSTTATYIDRYGVIKTAAIDEPREEKEGWLIEGASTNLLLNSDTTVAQTNIGPTGVSDATTFPKFTNGLQFQSASGATLYAIKTDLTPTIGTTYTMSVFVIMDDGSTPVVNSTIGDLFLSLDNSVTVDKPEIIELIDKSSNLYRIQATRTATSTSFKYGVYSYSTGTQKGFRVTGYQLESLPFASSYIPTTIAAVTRAADIVSTDFNNNLLINGDLSVIFNFSANIEDITQRYFMSYTPSTGFIFLTSTLGGLRNKWGSTAVSQISGLNDNQNYNSAIVIKSGILTAYLDATASSTTITADADGTNAALFYIGSSSGLLQMFGHLKDLRIYDFALNADEVQFLAGE